jgi:hypothetical protein
MDDEQKVNQLANMLFSKGLAASMWDAKSKAMDIMGLSSKKMDKAIEESAEQVEEEEADLKDIMQDDGVSSDSVQKAEDQKIEEVKEEFQKTLEKEESSEVSEGEAEKVELPSDVFSLDGVDGETSVKEAAFPESVEPAQDISIDNNETDEGSQDEEVTEEQTQIEVEETNESESEQEEVQEDIPISEPDFTNGDDMVDIDEPSAVETASEMESSVSESNIEEQESDSIVPEQKMEEIESQEEDNMESEQKIENQAEGDAVEQSSS